jgi:hypothetical protein
MCLLQDDIVKFVSEPASPPRLVEIPEEGKGKAKSTVKSVKVTTLSSSRTRQTKKTRRRFRSGSSCGRGSTALDCPMSPSSVIL